MCEIVSNFLHPPRADCWVSRRVSVTGTRRKLWQMIKQHKNRTQKVLIFWSFFVHFCASAIGKFHVEQIFAWRSFVLIASCMLHSDCSSSWTKVSQSVMQNLNGCVGRLRLITNGFVIKNHIRFDHNFFVIKCDQMWSTVINCDQQLWSTIVINNCDQQLWSKNVWSNAAMCNQTTCDQTSCTWSNNVINWSTCTAVDRNLLWSFKIAHWMMLKTKFALLFNNCTSTAFEQQPTSRLCKTDGLPSGKKQCND
jgi:hypothetical protein